MGRDGRDPIGDIFDMIQFRYGWTDQTIRSLTFLRFRRLIKVIIRAREKEETSRLIVAAFIGWQMGAGDKKSFSAYLDSLGLSGEPRESTEPLIDKQTVDAKLKGLGIVPAEGKVE